MKLQRFVGKNTKSVLDEIRTSLGEEALIVSNTKVGSKTEIIAASESNVKIGDDSEIAINIDVQQEVAEATSSKSFSSFMSSQGKPTSQHEDVDPWTYIQSINQEINYIKSSLDQLPKIRSDIQKNSQKEGVSSSEKTDHLNNLPSLDLNISKGSYVIWGDRESGKSTVIKQLLRDRKNSSEDITIIRLPHKHSNIDPHLSAIASRYSANLIYINHLDQTEKMVEFLGRDSLLVIEADLSILPKLTVNKEITWLEASFNYLINEDQEQTDLLLKLFSEIKASEPTTLSGAVLKNMM